MKISGLHLLITYQCTFACDHCFVWGSPWQSGTMTSSQIRKILSQARETGSIGKIYFEGGEPFLYYSLLLAGVQAAAEMGFQVGIVSNAYWATSEEDARACLKPFQGLIEDLTVSSDLYHYNELNSLQARNAEGAAKQLGISIGTISVAQPERSEADQGSIMYRGRAARKLVARAPQQGWEQFTRCPYEDLRDPGRVHLDPFGYVHICQGISLGNIFEQPLAEICDRYDPETHAIVRPLLAGGPATLVSEYAVPHQKRYADACQLCYESRLFLRDRFPGILTPDQMYGVGVD
jgi:MoaA/NifB/PqqE/SkfB family radical SAM enzyme